MSRLGGLDRREFVAKSSLAVTSLAGVPAATGRTFAADGTNPVDRKNDTVARDITVPGNVAKLTVEDGASQDHFGDSVAISDDGEAAVVGAWYDGDPTTGAAYVFKSGGGEWTQRTRLHPDDAGFGDQIGWSVAIADGGSIALVGAPSHDRRRGAAYVFAREGANWTQETKLAAGDGDSTDSFGWAVDLDDDGSTAIVAASSDEDPNGTGAGAAYVFTREGGDWNQEAKLAATDGDKSDTYGTSVSIAGDGSTVLVGAYVDEDPNGEGAGSAYAFTRSDGDWTQRAKLTPDDGDSGDYFGRSVAIDGDGSIAIVGSSQNEDPIGEKGGSAYVFTRGGGDWSKRTKLAPEDADSEDEFGRTVAIGHEGSTAIVGAYTDEDPHGENAGAAYVFGRGGDEWTQRDKLAAPDGDSGDFFGIAVGLAGDGSSGLVGAPGDEDPHGESAGAAYVFDSVDEGERGTVETERTRSSNGGEPRTTEAKHPPTTTGARRTTGQTKDPEGVTDTRSAARADDRTLNETDSASDGPGDSGSERGMPGFGLGTGLLALGGVALWRRLRKGDSL